MEINKSRSLHEARMDDVTGMKLREVKVFDWGTGVKIITGYMNT